MIILGFVLVAWIASLAWAHEIGSRHTAQWVFHKVAWGQYRGSRNGIVEDHGNCLDHQDCPYE